MFGSAESGEYFVANEMQISWKKQKEKATEWYALCLCSRKKAASTQRAQLTGPGGPLS